MAKGKKEQNLVPVSNVLQGLLGSGDSPLADQFLRWRLWQAWAQVVGPTVAKYSTPVGYKKGQLFIWVKSSAHSQELSFALDLVKSKVNQFAGYPWVSSIILTLDRKAVPKPDETSEAFKDFLSQADPSEKT